MAKAKKRKGKSRKGTANERDLHVHLVPTVELIHAYLTESLCDEVFRSVRDKERQRKWSLFGLARFWLYIILDPPQSLTKALELARRGDPRGLLPEVAASPEAFFEKCKGFSSVFFMALYARFIAELVRKAPKQYCREVAHLQKKFSNVVIFDGSRLGKVAHRLKILWSEKAAVLPGCVLAVYDIFRGIAVQLLFEADASKAEFKQAEKATMSLGPETLVMGDRLYCTSKLFRLLNKQGCFGLFRRNKSLSFKKIRLLSRIKKNGGIIEELLVKAGAGDNAIELRLIRLKVDGHTYEAFTNVLDTKRLTAEDIVKLYPLRWRIERLFYDLKVVLKLEKFHAANPNAVAMQVFAGAIVHAAFRVAQADIAKKVGIPPEELSTQKLFPLLAIASIKVIEAEFIFEVTRRANKRVKLRKPSWSNLPDTVVSLEHIRVERRSSKRKKRKFDPKRRNWKSFNKIRGGRKLT
jgi:IS4 transposase